ncbi:hypothetical protein L228DRAFT_267150 [Xylona heveae TC161]|uniref:N-acetyltransferase domain-containing protein n=1 Tax=Xylona heveae (strain CBS 132557 / TC161) TaxID=1328760 RepID=A0A165H8H1_XYLHT|nr:hypothetical protein L228DRAFT_267150 [Xylona heveae TC161]KZF23132.1 hypothetical protein L228DRAFT_267150 [Xylona heveae TC161]
MATTVVSATKPHATILSTSQGLPTTEQVRIVTVKEYKEAAQCLAEAFAEDDVARYFIDTEHTEQCTPEEKWKLHVNILEYVVYAHCLKGLVTTIGPNYDCVALWMPPGKNIDDLLTIFRSGMWRLRYQLCSEGKKRFFDEFLPLLHDTKLEVMGDRDDDSYYLVYIGTKSTARGKGYARKLIDNVTKQADAEGRACYLESSNAINPAIYRKLGFEERKKIFLSRAEAPIEMDIMVREPMRPTISSSSLLQGGTTILQATSASAA